MKRLRCAACALIPLALAAASRAGSHRDFELIDGGTFTLYLKGTRIGEEHFVIQQERGRTEGPVYRAGAELNLKLDGGTVRISVALEALGSECRPHRYEAKINGSAATTIVGTVVRDRMRLDVRSPRGDEMKEFLFRGRAAIVEKHIAHHHYFVWKLLEGNPSAEATVVIPTEGSQQRVTIEDLGEESLPIEDRELQLRHITMTSETGAIHHVWLDGDQVFKVDVPEEEFLAVRSKSSAR